MKNNENERTWMKMKEREWKWKGKCTKMNVNEWKLMNLWLRVILCSSSICFSYSAHIFNISSSFSSLLAGRGGGVSATCLGGRGGGAPVGVPTGVVRWGGVGFWRIELGLEVEGLVGVGFGVKVGVGVWSGSRLGVGAGLDDPESLLSPWRDVRLILLTKDCTVLFFVIKESCTLELIGLLVSLAKGWWG